MGGAGTGDKQGAFVKVDWHADAIKLSQDGRSSTDIARLLSKNRETVKKYLYRVSKDPERALATVVNSPLARPAAVKLNKERNNKLAEIMVETERSRSMTLLKAVAIAEEVLDLKGVQAWDDPQFRFLLQKGHFALELIKVLGAGAFYDLPAEPERKQIKGLKIQVVYPGDPGSPSYAWRKQIPEWRERHGLPAMTPTELALLAIKDNT